jgi:hypothetical protein
MDVLDSPHSSDGVSHDGPSGVQVHDASDGDTSLPGLHRIFRATMGLPTWGRYALAAVAVLCVFLLQLTVFQPPIAPFVFFYVAVVFAAWSGGRGSGLFAVFVSAAVANYSTPCRRTSSAPSARVSTGTLPSPPASTPSRRPWPIWATREPARRLRPPPRLHLEVATDRRGGWPPDRTSAPAPPDERLRLR